MKEAFSDAGQLPAQPTVRPGPVRVAGRIVRALAEWGIDRTFGIPGGTISPVTDALLDSGIEHVTCQHESMAVYMAAGYARATGKPGVVVVTSGPGVLNTLTGIAAAYNDEVPIVVLAGDVALPNQGRGALQDGSPAGLDIIRMASSITKLAASLDRPARAAALIEDALSLACAVPQGPVLLRLPVDCTSSDTQPEHYAQSVRATRQPDSDACSSIAQLLATARRPAILAGGAVRRVDASRALRMLAEATRTPVITDLEAKGVFPESNPLSLGIFGVGGSDRATRYLEGGVDLLITVGSRLDDTTTVNYSPLLQPKGTLVQIDHDPRRLGRAYRPDVTVCADLNATLERIVGSLPLMSGLDLLARDKELRMVPKLALEVPSLGSAPHDPRAVVVALQRAFDEDSTVFTSDIGNHLLFAGLHLECNRPDQFHVSLGLGGMTSGIGIAMGLAQAYGNSRRVVAICGDGGLMMCGNELATCARYEVPVILAVFNDGQLGMVQHGSERVYGRSHDFRTPTTNLTAYARAVGADAIRVETEDDLLRAAHSGWRRPLLLDIPIMPGLRAQNPRDETLNFPEAG